MIGSNFGLIMAVIWGLFSFGILFNWLVGYLERNGYAEGYMGLIVAFGCLITIVGVGIIDYSAALLTLIAFIASGSPMIFGSIVRYIRKREAMRKSILGGEE